jgi:hypothetical protein
LYHIGVTPEPPLLDPSHVAFLGTGLSMLVASRNAANVPSVARALGCRVSADRREVTLFLSASQSAALLDDLKSTRVVAAVFDEPPTHRAMQLKGHDATLSALEPGDVDRIAAWVDAFVVQLERIGYPEQLTRTFLDVPERDYLALRFTPTHAFTQTPGPDAGAPLPR